MHTDDLRYDKFAVRAFEKQTLDNLKAKGFVPKQIIQFCDNCVGQYKSKGPFQLVSESEIPILRISLGPSIAGALLMEPLVESNLLPRGL